MTKEQIIGSLKNTVGYNESDNKEEFLKGAGMALDKFLLLHDKVCEGKDRQNDRLETELESIKQTISNFGDLVQRVGEEQ